jgi:hypothetical protein
LTTSETRKKQGWWPGFFNSFSANSREVDHNSNTPDAITKYLSFHVALNMLSLVVFVRRAPPNTIALLIAAILSDFLSSLVSPLAAWSALEPPLKPSLYRNDIISR